MSLKVKFFASLKDQINLDEVELEYQKNLNPLQVWQLATHNAERPDNILVAVNLNYCDWQHLVQDHDEVAFFPPVTGG